jgi:hypothetical protein
VYKLLQRLYNNQFDYDKMTQSYKDILKCGTECSELRKYDQDIEKDLLRTFPKVPQFASSYQEGGSNCNSANKKSEEKVNMSFSVYQPLSENQIRLSRVL